jgi:D-arabinose 1-dehydrogenase-like Zn-dependent alcohol dehydrogenase
MAIAAGKAVHESLPSTGRTEGRRLLSDAPAHTCRTCKECKSIKECCQVQATTNYAEPARLEVLARATMPHLCATSASVM